MKNNAKALKIIIVAICIAVPLLVAVLSFLPQEAKSWGLDTSFLPVLNAGINSLTAVLLILALLAVKSKQFELHKKLMLVSLTLGSLFLLSYVAYHATTPSVKYGDINHDGILDEFEQIAVSGWRLAYIILLASHIILSIVVLPFVLFAVYFALTENNQKHKSIVKFAFPVWLYISVTGVLVYFMISPYYV